MLFVIVAPAVFLYKYGIIAIKKDAALLLRISTTTNLTRVGLALVIVAFTPFQ